VGNFSIVDCDNEQTRDFTKAQKQRYGSLPTSRTARTSYCPPDIALRLSTAFLLLVVGVASCVSFAIIDHQRDGN